MLINSKTATAAIALLIAAGAYPAIGIAQSDTNSVDEGDKIEVQSTETDKDSDTTRDTDATSEDAESAGDNTATTARGGKAGDKETTSSTTGADEGLTDSSDRATSAGSDTDDMSSSGSSAMDDDLTTTDRDTDLPGDGSDESAEGGDAATGSATGAAAVSDPAVTEDADPNMLNQDGLDAEQEEELDEAAAEDKPVPPEDMLMGMQRDDQWLSSELIKQNVLNPEGDTIGDVGGIIFGNEGPEGVIVEVGGFLGIGKKDVAIRWSELTITEDGIVVDATKDELKNAPEFVSLEDQGVEAGLHHREGLFEKHGSITRDDTGAMDDGLGTPPADEGVMTPEENTIQ